MPYKLQEIWKAFSYITNMSNEFILYSPTFNFKVSSSFSAMKNKTFSILNKIISEIES